MVKKHQDRLTRIKAGFKLSDSYDLHSDKTNLSPADIDFFYQLDPLSAKVGGTYAKQCVYKWGSTEEKEEHRMSENTGLENLDAESPSTEALQPSKHKLFGLCSAALCRGNPHCVNWIGQADWEKEDRGLAKYLKLKKLELDCDNTRKDGLPVGIKNLGTTCYVNSYFQVWFHNLRFRDAIYSCSREFDEDRNFLHQIQLLFTFLQTSRQSFYNPKEFIDMLEIGDIGQQDAQEFGKFLFDSVLEPIFKIQNTPESPLQTDMSTVMDSLVKGTIEYRTTCRKCHNVSTRYETFVELNVNLTRNCKLEDCLNISLATEELIGENQYYCSKCDCLQDASRASALTKLPPILHISVNRMKYSLKTNSRIKSHLPIIYPITFDTQSVFDTKQYSGEFLKYSLQGVLLHHGSAAQAGHYTAQVYDTIQKKWFYFNDDFTSELDELNKLIQGGPVVHPNSSKLEFFIEEDNHVFAKSKECYMLVYVLDAGQEDSQIPTPPNSVVKVVQQMDDENDQEVQEYKNKKAAAFKEFSDLKQPKQQIYNDMCRSYPEPMVVVPSQDLEEFFEVRYPIIVAESPGLEDLESQTDSTSESEIKDAISNLTGNSNEARNETEEKTEAISDGAMKPKDERIDEEKEKRTPQNNINEPAQTCLDEQVKGLVLSTPEFLCPHHRLHPANVDKCKIIPKRVAEMIQGNNMQDLKVLELEEANCRDCVWEIVSERIFMREHTKNLTKFNSIQECADGIHEINHVISAQWLSEWKKRPNPRLNGALLKDSNPNIFDKDILCSHSRLHPDRKRYYLLTALEVAFFQSLFPDWVPLTYETGNCQRCQEVFLEEKAKGKAEIALRATEKIKLSSFHKFDNGSLPIKSEFQFAVPYPFMMEWHVWSTGRGLRPQKLNTEVLCCQHGMLNLDVDEEVFQPVSLLLVSPEEWGYLTENYGDAPAIMVQQHDDDPDRVHTMPEPCRKCTHILSRNVLWIRIFRTPTKPKHQIKAKPCRRRIQRKALRRGLRSVGFVEEDTIHAIKMKIYDELCIPTIHQRLYYAERELENNETVASIGLAKDSVIELEELTAHDIDLTQSDENTGKRNRERGFSEILVTEGANKKHRKVQELTTVSCSHCTFKQTVPEGTANCEMCESVLVWSR